MPSEIFFVFPFFKKHPKLKFLYRKLNVIAQMEMLGASAFFQIKN